MPTITCLFVPSIVFASVLLFELCYCGEAVSEELIPLIQNVPVSHPLLVTQKKNALISKAEEKNKATASDCQATESSTPSRRRVTCRAKQVIKRWVVLMDLVLIVFVWKRPNPTSCNNNKSTLVKNDTCPNPRWSHS